MPNLLMFILLVIVMCASTLAQTPAPRKGDRVFDPPPSITSLAEADRLADEAVKRLLATPDNIEATEPRPQSPLDFIGRDRAKRVQERIKMTANDVISNFAGHINKRHPSLHDICAGTRLLDAAVKRHLEKQLGPNPSPKRKSYEAEEFLRREPAIETLYTTIGTCTALVPWIDKPAVKKK